MEFSKFDMVVVIVMTVVVITMSFVFPALGLTGTQQTENDVPEFNITTDAYEFRGDFPKSPGAPTQGTMHWVEASPDSEPSQSIFLNGDASNGTELAIVQTNTVDDPEMTLYIQNWTNGAGVAEDQVTLNNTSEYGQVQWNDWTVTFEWTEERYVGTNDFEASVDFTVTEQPTDTNWYDRVPIVGDIFGAGEALAGMVGWIGSILFWLVGTVTAIIWNTFAIVLDTLAYAFGLVYWLVTTYFNIVDGATNFASVFLMIPGVLLFVEFLKMGFIGVDLIWLG